MDDFEHMLHRHPQTGNNTLLDSINGTTSELAMKYFITYKVVAVAVNAMMGTSGN